MNTNEIYAKITEQIIAGLEVSGSWVKLWQVPAPVSLHGRFYHGINELILALSPYKSRVFGTFKQVRENGGQVRKGEKSTQVVFWKIGLQEDAVTGKQERTFLLRLYYVFNSEQCDFDEQGLAKIAELNNAVFVNARNRIQSAESIIDSMPHPPEIIRSKADDSAYYAPVADFVSVPDIDFFKTADAFYQTMFHELVHCTGHPKRLNRFDGMSNRFGDNEYSKEELVAEIGASFLSVVAGCTWNERNSTAYIRGWSKALRDNQKWIVWAASRAEKAANFILNNKEPEFVTETVTAETEAVLA